MQYTNNTQFIEYVKQLVGKQILFKLTDDIDDKGLIGTLKEFKNDLIINRDKIDLAIKLYDLYYIEEYK